MPSVVDGRESCVVDGVQDDADPVHTSDVVRLVYIYCRYNFINMKHNYYHYHGPLLILIAILLKPVTVFSECKRKKGQEVF